LQAFFVRIYQQLFDNIIILFIFATSIFSFFIMPEKNFCECAPGDEDGRKKRSYYFIQPRHPLAPRPPSDYNVFKEFPEPLGQIFMPSSLTVAAARLEALGHEVHIIDANLVPDVIGTLKWESDRDPKPIVGINVIGAPLIPGVQELVRGIQNKMKSAVRIVIGGQTIAGLSDQQFESLFELEGIRPPNTKLPSINNVIKGDSDERQKVAFRIGKEALPPEENVSLIPVYQGMDLPSHFRQTSQLELYLKHEMSLYLSQGCKYGCTFCAAKRSTIDSLSGRPFQEREIYRDLNVVEKDLRYLVARAQSNWLPINMLEMYLSNLDLFQTPAKMLDFAQRVNKIKAEYPAFQFRFRGLCTVKSFMVTYQKRPEVIEECCKAGLETIGFGVDGIAPEVWKSIKKGHNKVNDCVEAIKIAMQFGITPEILMVFGHAADTPETMRQALEFMKLMVEQYGAVPRPYVAKDLLPGNSGWIDPKNKGRVETLIQHPESFLALDMCARPSSISHPDAEFRATVSKLFEEALHIRGCVTGAIDAITHDMSDATKRALRGKNMGCYDR
jgi:hypothetical protein